MTAQDFGRVAEDGTVFVRTADGERAVGSYPGATAEEALAYFARKYDDIGAQINLFAQRLNNTEMSPRDIDAGIKRLREATTEPNAVGDLAALTTRVDALDARAAEKRAEASAARAAARAEHLATRAALVEEAEKIAATPPERTQWRTDGQRMKDLFDAWKAQQKDGPRLDRGPEEELWHRFSHARTTFDRHRRQHFAQLESTQGEVKLVKQGLVKEAEALATSKDWGPTSAAYKRLMDRWRAAGRASRKDDDALWARFRAAQDTFFAARNAVQAAEEAEFQANLAVKEALLTEAEAILPITRPGRGQGVAARDPGALGGGRQGAARRHGAGRAPDPQGRAGRPRRRGGAVEAHQPRGAGPRAERGRPARGGAGRAAGQAGQGPGQGRRQGGRRGRGVDRGPHRCGSSRPSARWTSSAASDLSAQRASHLPERLTRRWLRCVRPPVIR